MSHQSPGAALHMLFTAMEAAIQQFETVAAQAAPGSPRLEAALQDLEHTWTRFVTEWRTLCDLPIPADAPASLAALAPVPRV